MTPQAIRLRKVVRDLTNVMREEARALASRNFKSLADLTGRKAQIAKTLPAMVSGNGDVMTDDKLIAEVKALQALANANAAQLKALRDGVARARQSLEKITDANASAGVYGAHGRILRAEGRALRSRDA